MYQMYQTEAVYLLSVESCIIFNVRPGYECVVFFLISMAFIMYYLELVGHNKETEIR